MPEICEQCETATGRIQVKYESTPNNAFTFLCGGCYDANLFSETILEVGDIYTDMPTVVEEEE